MALEWIRQHGKSAGIGLVALAACGFAAYSVSTNSRGRPRPVSEGRVYFSTDDGQTWFEDSVQNPSPFDKDGEQAYRVFVWKQGDGKPFVSHMMRSGNASGPTLPGSARSPSVVDRRPLPPPSSGGVEVKRPGTGDKGWVRANSREGEEIMRPKGPDGTTNGLEPIEP